MSIPAPIPVARADAEEECVNLMQRLEQATSDPGNPDVESAIKTLELLDKIKFDQKLLKKTKIVEICGKLRQFINHERIAKLASGLVSKWRELPVKKGETFSMEGFLSALRAHDVETLVDMLSQSSSIDLKMKRIGAKVEKELGSALSQDSPLTSLNLECSEIRSEEVKVLGAALAQNTSLTLLYLGKNLIGDEGAKALAAALAQNSSLTALNVRESQIGAEGAKAMSAALVQNSSLATLYLGYNLIGAAGAKAVGIALALNSSLSVLYLGDNQLSDEGAKALAAALAQNSSLDTLDLGCNQIGDEGAKALATSLVQNSSLTTLYLGYNLIGAEGGVALGNAVAENTSLTSLNLSDNQIGDDGAKALIDAFAPIELSHSSSATSSLSSSGTDAVSLPFSIYVKAMNGDLLSVDCHSQESVESIKRKLCLVNTEYCAYRLQLLVEDHHQGSHQAKLSSSSSSVAISSMSTNMLSGVETSNLPVRVSDSSCVNHFIELSDSRVLADYDIGAEDTLHLLLLPRKNTTLRCLYVSSNGIGPEYCSHLQRLCDRNKEYSKSK